MKNRIIDSIQKQLYKLTNKKFSKKYIKIYILPIIEYICFSKSNKFLISGAQGIGKSTLLKVIESNIEIFYNKKVLTLSLDDYYLSKKTRLSLLSDIKTILCVGETITEYNKKMTKNVISRQLKSALSKSKNLFKSDQSKIVIAYEPVWAIGNGKTANLQDIASVHGFIRAILNKILGTKQNTIKILYGGSVNNENAPSILNLPDVNGALVGGASLNPKKFIDICSSI